MRIDVLSIFPDMFAPLTQSMIGKALEKDLLQFQVTDFRQYSHDKHHHVDDTPYGGGAGMLLKPEPIFEAMDAINATHPGDKRVILLDPAGKTFNQGEAKKLAKEDHLVFICGHYEGYDERIRSLVTDEYSLGDFVLTGGELPAMVMIDAIARLLPGVLGNAESAPTDSFENNLLEYPEYTRPASYRGMDVPFVLQNGDHQKIADWRLKEALRRTLLRRPDLLEHVELDTTGKRLLREVRGEEAGRALDDKLSDE
ncbi:tRNA (guanosine(37)-N1)-methyltransferase TrmD [Lacticaseibacillus camelliae]|uniref:tRNA (guanine-N(1)-)-methyltransferase n=1 Tax=Lacticaseibacillus camelliae DSM 22697 = JCM 13995 TaxID=1423730 RepID=A0A0R2F440_9LACO|nr:tRNA (guanosine(37)-N1)-methyltransferase TrmD [Lacticaseibacillus camelliae]KRN22267.1 tRNA (guanine-N(1)-)-methyltransferase [Lacticaseibacillus camelliae DSM 22697 = JCM 13995]